MALLVCFVSVAQMRSHERVRIEFHTQRTSLVVRVRVLVFDVVFVPILARVLVFICVFPQ